MERRAKVIRVEGGVWGSSSNNDGKILMGPNKIFPTDYRLTWTSTMEKEHFGQENNIIDEGSALSVKHSGYSLDIWTCYCKNMWVTGVFSCWDH